MFDDPTLFPELKHLQPRVDALAGSHDALIDLCIAVQQIAAPTGAEGERAAWVEERFCSLGLADVVQDSHNNVYARLPGKQAGPALMLSAHIDTVFPAETDLTIRRDDARHRVGGPGLGDNSTGVAGLLTLAQLLRTTTPAVDIWFVANSCEEGLGDLRGMRAAVERLNGRESGQESNLLGACIVIEGMGLGRIVHQALGSRRYKIGVTAPGGHSWSAFGTPSAVHVLVQLAERVTRLAPPHTPRTTWNIGRIRGGTSINSIAENAWLELDLRSEQGHTLAAMVEQVNGIVRRYQSPQWRQKGVYVSMDPIGDRPTGEIAANHPLVIASERALKAVGVAVEPGERMSSTDANIPLSLGIPAVCVGITRGGNAHRLDEWISTLELTKGMQHLLLLSAWAAGWLGEKRNW
jgi:acetylornithine deacetylase/succinyl-diaminopimelate desuccinylase-like protein